MEINKIYEGTCLDVIRTFPDKSIDCVITSPPYWQLRDYGWDGQWGNEPTFHLYLEHLWSLMDEIYRVLKDTGTCWVNLGDTYSSQGGPSTNQTIQKDSGFDWDNSNVKKERYKIDYGVPNKCLLLIPHRFGIGCIDRKWIMRNDIIWAKRNGMPESMTDRFTKKHEYFFFMVKQETYFFDLDVIRDNPITQNSIRNKGESDYGKHLNMGDYPRRTNHDLGKNPGSISDFWDIPTKPNSDDHYASYNTKLIDKPIEAGCPKGGIILDPFCGTATTGCRAIDLQRKFIGIEGKPEYVKIGNKKLLPFQISQQLF